MSATRRRSRKSVRSSTYSLKNNGTESSLSRPQSSTSRKVVIDENDVIVQDNVDFFSPRDDPSTKKASGMSSEPYSMQTQMVEDKRADKTYQSVDCLTRFLRALRKLWRTRMTEDTDNDPELKAKITLRELGIYITFIIVLCILTFGMASSDMYYFTKMMKGLFVDSPKFNQMTTMKGFWDYAEDGLMKGLYWEKYYNGKGVKVADQGYIYFENKILGRPRIRQVRVRNDSCTVHEDFKKVIKDCYAPYAPSTEEKRPFGISNGTAWEYQTPEELKGGSTWGKVSTYEGGGYTVLLPNNEADAKTLLANLKKELWLDQATRAAFIDITVYNANINLFCIMTLMIEFPATGGCVPFAQFRTYKLLRYVTSLDYFVMACEVIFIMYLLYYLVEELIELKKRKISYLFDIWNVLDMVVIGMGFLCVVLNLYRTLAVNKLLTELLQSNPDQYANFEIIRKLQELSDQFLAAFVFIAWIKMFKYLSFNKTMTQLQSTLAQCAGDVFGFAIMFCIIFMAYAQWGYLLFATQVKGFSTYLQSVYTLFRVILGDFDYNEMENANRYLGPIYFVTYVFIVLFVLLNMFLAIINDTYAEVKSDLAEQVDEFNISDYFKKGYNAMVKNLAFKQKVIKDIENILQSEANADNLVDFEEWKTALKAQGHLDSDIEAVFAKYDTDGDRVLNLTEQQEMLEDLQNQKEMLEQDLEKAENAKGKADDMNSRLDLEGDDDDSNDEEEKATVENFTILGRKVDRIEHTIGSIVSRIDVLQVKLEAVANAKNQRRDTMTQLLDDICEDIPDVRRARKRQQLEVEINKSEASLRPQSRQATGSVFSVKETASLANQKDETIV